MRIEGLLPEIEAMVSRREAAAAIKPKCPSCGSEQVQLTDWRKWPVQFKCRTCRYRFGVG